MYQVVLLDPVPGLHMYKLQQLTVHIHVSGGAAGSCAWAAHVQAAAAGGGEESLHRLWAALPGSLSQVRNFARWLILVPILNVGTIPYFELCQIYIRNSSWVS